MRKNVLSAFAAIIALTACGDSKTGEPAGLSKKRISIYSSIDTGKIVTEADVVAQYKVYLDLKKKNKEVLENEPLAAVEDLNMLSFFMQKKTRLINLESKAYLAMDAAMDSLDRVYEEK